MREYGKVATRFWTDPAIMRVSAMAKLVAQYLLTGPETNLIGCFRCVPYHLSANSVGTPDEVRAAFDELVEIGFMDYDDETGTVYLTNWFKYNTIPNQDAGKAALSRLKELQPSDLTAKVIQALTKFDDKMPHGWRHACGHGCQHGCAPQEQEQEQEQEGGKDAPSGASPRSPRVATRKQLDLLADIAAERGTTIEAVCARRNIEYPPPAITVTALMADLKKIDPTDPPPDPAKVEAHRKRVAQWEADLKRQIDEELGLSTKGDKS